MKAKQKELDRLEKFGAYETVDIPIALGKKRAGSWTTERSESELDFVAREFKGDDTTYDVFAPSSTPCTRRIIDDLSLKKSSHTFTAEANAYFHLDVGKECYVDPLAEWSEQQAALGNSTSVLWRLRKQLYGRIHGETRWVDSMAYHNALQTTS